MSITYCTHKDCYYRDCVRHLDNAPKGRLISIADLNDGFCFIPENVAVNKRERLLAAICKGVQNTHCKCDNPTRAVCDAVGDCTFCHTIADAVEALMYEPLEASWVDVTKPGQVTCGGNPVYACGNCGDIYGSFELFPSAKYCRECGAKMKGAKK